MRAIPECLKRHFVWRHCTNRLPLPSFFAMVDWNHPVLCCTGSVSVLPTVLYLTIGVLRELAPKGATSLPPMISAALQCLKTLCSSPLCKDPRCSAGWIRHLQSALASIIEYSQPGRYTAMPLSLGFWLTGSLLIQCSEGHPACKITERWFCWWWWFDWSFARLVVLVVTTTSSSFAPIKSRMETFRYRLTRVHLENGCYNGDRYTSQKYIEFGIAGALKNRQSSVYTPYRADFVP